MYRIKIIDVFCILLNVHLIMKKIKSNHYKTQQYNIAVDEKEKLFKEHNIEIPVKVNDRVYKKYKTYQIYQIMCIHLVYHIKPKNNFKL